MILAAAPLLADSQGLPVWRILATDLAASLLLSLWQAWRTMANPPQVVHLVVVTAQVPSAVELQTAIQQAGAADLAVELAAQWPGLMPGFHRLSLAEGRFQLTLCLGELLPMLRELHFEADSVWLASTQNWDRWSLTALAQCCRRGALTLAPESPADLQDLLGQAGFRKEAQCIRYAPPWAIRNRQPKPTRQEPADCAIIGAGLAGAAVAASLARRGWRVQVFDAGASPAAGASALPVGLLVPHVSKDDSPRSRLSRAGLRLTRHEAERLLRPKQDWGPTGVLERRLDQALGLPEWWPPDRQDLSQAIGQGIASSCAPWHADVQPTAELWHPQAAWVKPGQLVRAWLAGAGIEFIGRCQVDQLHRATHGWQLRNPAGEILGQASHVVLANACDAQRLLHQLAECLPLPTLQTWRGQLSYGLHPTMDTDDLPPFPVNGLGSLIPGVPSPQGLTWYLGASYEDPQAAELPDETIHQENLDKLRQLLPRAAAALAPAFSQAQVSTWGGLRCVSPDRLPVVGPLQSGSDPTLWISTAMGSRGLTFSALCAELLAAWMMGEPLPVERSLAAKLALQRFHARK